MIRGTQIGEQIGFAALRLWILLLLGSGAAGYQCSNGQRTALATRARIATLATSHQVYCIHRMDMAFHTEHCKDSDDAFTRRMSAKE